MGQYIFKKISPNNGVILKGAFSPKLVNSPLASCTLIDRNFLLMYAADFDKNIILYWFLKLLDLYFPYLFYTINNMIT